MEILKKKYSKPTFSLKHQKTNHLSVNKTIKTLALLCFIFTIGVTSCSKDEDTPHVNRPPSDFNLISVLDKAFNVELKPTLTWETSLDPDGDLVKYDLYLELTENVGEVGETLETIIASDLTTTFYTLEDNLKIKKEYLWKVVAKDDKGESKESNLYGFRTRDIKIENILQNFNAPFSPRQSPTLEVFNNKLFLIGGFDGSNFKNDVWNSADGLNWSLSTSAAAFSPRNRHSSFVFDNKIWILGGVEGTTFHNDVWSSEDGSNWILAQSPSAIFARDRHTTTLFKNRIWFIGGKNQSGNLVDQILEFNGTQWNFRPSPFSPRSSHACVVYDDKIWIIGGKDASGKKNDVWSSEDGVSWTEVTPNADFSPRSEHKVEVFENKMWLIAGFDDSFLKDMWSSTDGITWTRASPSENPIPYRTFFATASFKDKLWFTSGVGGPTRYNDIWTLY